MNLSITKTFVDGDIVAYRMAASAEAKSLSLSEAARNVDGMMEDVLQETLVFPENDDYEVFLTGKGNYRYDVATVAVYKGNRSGKPKPEYLPAMREHLEDRWGAIVSEGEEADDLISKAVTAEGPTSCVASIDKDMLQLNCWHYNLVKRTMQYVEHFDGLSFFYQQILMGDSADNIIGIDGVGPKTAEKMLKDCKTEEDLYEVCLKAYDGDRDRVVENGRLLWLRRTPDEHWEPPCA